ncbi:MAG TPA: hypothetical protein VFT19_02650 [Solirubrobacterales bacterium]|nr:hypothetical protein [Solirubrobacterales bacterium]
MSVDRHRFDRHVVSSGDFYPRDCAGAPSELHAECLIGGIEPRIEVTVRFAQTVERQVLDRTGEPVAELLVTGRRHRSGEETVEHEVRIDSLPGRTAVVRAAGTDRAELVEGGRPAGALLWRREPLHATVEAWIDRVGSGLHRVRVDVANRLEAGEAGLEQARRRALHSTHLVMHSVDGAFASPVAFERLRAA